MKLSVASYLYLKYTLNVRIFRFVLLEFYAVAKVTVAYFTSNTCILLL